MARAEMQIGLVVTIVIALLIMTIIFLLIGRGFTNVDDQSRACEDTYGGVCDLSEDQCREQRGVVVSAGACASGNPCCRLVMRQT